MRLSNLNRWTFTILQCLAFLLLLGETAQSEEGKPEVSGVQSEENQTSNGEIAEQPTKIEGKIVDVYGRIGGEVLSISISGRLNIEGREVALWGVDLKNISRIEEIVVGRKVSCNLLLEEERYIVADCVLRPKQSIAPMSSTLDLYTWLVDFDFAEPSCSANDPWQRSVIHAGVWTYSCTSVGQPERLPYTVSGSSNSEVDE